MILFRKNILFYLFLSFFSLFLNQYWYLYDSKWECTVWLIKDQAWIKYYCLEDGGGSSRSECRDDNDCDVNTNGGDKCLKNQFPWICVWTNNSNYPSTPLCSITLRWSSTISLQSLFPWVDKNKFDFNGRDNQIEGSTSWHDNFANCNNGTIFESSSWSSFWSKNIANVSTWTAWTSYNSNVKQSDVVKLQTYINSKCSLWLTPDGKIGIKTLNAAMICNTLKESWTSNIPTDWTNGMTGWTNGMTGWWTPNASTASCFKNPLPNWYNYTNNFTWNGEWQGDGCSCKSGYKKITKQIQNDKGVQDTVSVCEKCDPKKCNCGIKLNTNIPFIWRCIMYGNTNNTWLSWDVTTVNSVSAFPILMGAIIRILVSAILLVCFGTLIVWWFMMTVPDQYKTGKWLVMKVVYTIAALWSLWIILYLVNPNFFK